MPPSTLGSILRRRRRQLEITQQDIAKRIGVRANYVGYLERDLRRPSTDVLLKLARALDLDREELFFIANPQMRRLIGKNGTSVAPRSAWDDFRRDRGLHTRHGITRTELKVLEGIAQLGTASSPRDYLFILQAIRQALVHD